MKQAQRWIQIRHDLYKHIQARVRQRMGKETSELRSYRTSLESDLKKKWKASSVEELILRSKTAEVVFLSDFHALKQSQRTHLRILRRSLGPSSLVLALECIQASHQRHIDAFVRGRLSEKEFLKRVHWTEQWGFPWENYQPLFAWAIQNKIPIFGINIRQGKAGGIKARDQFAAQKILKIHQKNPHQQIFVVYGDLHMATAHLPKLVRKNGLSYLRVLQNSEDIYFQILRRNQGEEIEVVRLDNESYCVLNVPPWVKWQNYLMFLEETYDIGLDESVDFTDHVMSFVKVMGKELGLKISLSDLSVYSAKDPLFWEKVESHTTLLQRKWILMQIEEEGCFYLPARRMGYLSRGSVNQAASLAMEYILFKTSQSEDQLLPSSDKFTQLIWVKAWAYFGSKLINPKRKTDTLSDIKTRLTLKDGQTDREPLQLALSQKIYELILANQGKKYRFKFKPKRRVSYLIAAELLGGLMGERIYASYENSRLSSTEIRQWLKTSLSGKDFDQDYFKFIKFLEKTPMTFTSKEERI